MKALFQSKYILGVMMLLLLSTSFIIGRYSHNTKQIKEAYTNDNPQNCEELEFSIEQYREEQKILLDAESHYSKIISESIESENFEMLAGVSQLLGDILESNNFQGLPILLYSLSVQNDNWHGKSIESEMSLKCSAFNKLMKWKKAAKYCGYFLDNGKSYPSHDLYIQYYETANSHISNK